MRGRKPKPTRVRAITGNPGKRPLNPSEPMPELLTLDAIPEPPSELSKRAQAEWHRLAPQLATLRILTALDRAALAAYCAAYALWAEAIEAVGQYGAMVKSPTGYPMQSPYIGMANRQAEIMLRIASEFGFTPASRARIVARQTQEPDLFGNGEDRGV